MKCNIISILILRVTRISRFLVLIFVKILGQRYLDIKKKTVQLQFKVEIKLNYHR